ncbi:MAG: class I SAM-dependent methyltransferase [Candidatus Dojkabacteria bacterium]
MPNGLALAILLLVALLFFAYTVSLLLNFFTPFFTTPKKILKDILPLFKLKKDEKFTDLGSGDGRVVFAVYRKYKSFSTGYEISPMLLIYFKLKKLLLFPFNRKIEIKEENFLKTDLSKYDVIYCCLPMDLLEILEKKFEKELKAGSRVFTYGYPLAKKKGKKISTSQKDIYQYTY